MKWLPKDGLTGRALEAIAPEYIALRDQIEGALRAAWKLADGDDSPWPWVRALYADAVVVERDGGLLRYPYAITDGTLTLGAPEAVTATYAPVTAIQSQVPTAAGDQTVAVAEAVGGAITGSTDATADARFEVRVVRAGVSTNGNLYPIAVLREAAGRFDGVRVFAKSDSEHLRGVKDVRDMVGVLSACRFVEAAGGGEVRGTLTLLNPAAEFSATLREAARQGLAGLYGLSLDAVIGYRLAQVGGRTVREATRFDTINSVDLVVDASAGGGVIRAVEAMQHKEQDDMNRARVLEAISRHRPALLSGKDTSRLTDAELDLLLDQALAGPSGAGPGNGDVFRAVEARMAARDQVNRSRLPEAAKARVLEALSGITDPAELGADKVGARVTAEFDYLTRSGLGRGFGAAGSGDGATIEVVEAQADKVRDRLDAFFDPKHKDHRAAGGIRDIYVDLTGDRRVTGHLRNCDRARVSEALGSDTLGDVLGDGIRRRMIADYRSADVLDGWRQIVTVGNPNDFRNQERTRWGGYGDLPVVDESDPYVALDTPGDEEAKYKVVKRGGLETVTLETIKNDDVGAVRSIPTKLARSAKRTVSKFVFSFIRDNPVIYDGKALFHVDHGNLLTVALTQDGYAAARLAMVKQPMPGVAEDDYIYVGPKYLLVPGDLERTAADLFRRSTNLDATFVQSLHPTIIPVPSFIDPDDWAVVSDPQDIPTIEIGFLDGQEEPEMFIQDQPNSGSMFFNDVITYKIRHIYGGCVLDYRGMVKSVVP